jgi:hypothetical protein
MKYIVLSMLFLALVTLTRHVSAQPVAKGEKYTIGKLSQEPVQVTNIPQVSAFEEVGDTSFTIYSKVSTSFKTYFVNGPQYDNIFNPNPTGIYLNGRHFVFYCGIEMSIRQNFSNILDVKEFSFLSKTYLMLINFREDCEGDGCAYRCYNLFDITNPERIAQVSFSSVFEGIETFGEFNSDGVIDFIRVAPKPAKDAKGNLQPNYLITAYTMPKSSAQQLTNKEGHAYYLYVKGDEEIKNFQVLQADWFYPVKDTTGQIAPNTSYFAPYISFDPMYRYLYSPDGVRIEKNRWSVFLADLGDLEAAQEYCRKIKSKKVGEPYIMVDQYSGDIKFQVFVGNYISRDLAAENLQRLQGGGMKGKIIDLRNDY